MSAYTKIPQLNIAATVGKPVGDALGVVVDKGHKALNVVEFLISDTREKTSIIKKEIRDIQRQALQEAAELERKATIATNAVLSEHATTAYNDFLNKILPGTTVARVDVDVSPTVRMLHQEIDKRLNNAATRVSQLIAQSTELSNTTLKTVDVTLGLVEGTLTTVIKLASTFRKLIKTLRAPLTALKAAIIVIKAIPLPQRYLVVSFTILESDLLEMMEQLIAQAEEEVRAIESILAMIEGMLTPLRDRIRRIRAMIAAMKTDDLFLQASEYDMQVLDQAGLYDKDSRDSIFDKIQDGQGSNSGWECFGGSTGDLNLADPVIGNQIQVTDPGNYILCPGYASGSYVEDYYKWQVDQPPYPKGRPEDEGWSRYPDRPNDLLDPQAQLWRLSLLETGTGVIYGGFDNPIVSVPAKEWDDLFKTIDQYKSIQAGVGVKSDKEGEVINYDPLTGYRYGSKVLILDETNFDKKPGILKPSSWDALEIAALDRLRNLPLTQELQDYLKDIWQESAAERAGTSTIVDDAVAYRAANGELYYLRVVEDEHSPKVAVRRYVQVKDERGVIILDGIKTFSLNKESLIEEMKLQLDQMTR